LKKRLDVLCVERGLAASREKAKAIIMSGIVYVDGVREDKAGTSFDETAVIEVRGTTLKYVSRGGLKLEKAMEVFRVCGKRLGEGLSILIDVLNPECIVIGSIYQRCEDLLRPWAMEVIAREALAQAAGVCRVVPAQLGDQIGDYAAIAIAAAKLDAN
jgi:predicted NBD/HSP70 family sugar kinase